MTPKKEKIPASLGDSNEDTAPHACRILITCDQPADDGKMHVEMNYEGDPVLASYILDRAQGFIEHDDCES